MTVHYWLLSHEHLTGLKVGKKWQEMIEDCLAKNVNEPRNTHCQRSCSVHAGALRIVTPEQLPSDQNSEEDSNECQYRRQTRDA